MTGGTFATTINAPIDRVWAVVGDLNTHGSWSPKPYQMTWTSGEPNQVGSRIHSVGWIPGNKQNENDTEIAERVEPTKLVLRANDAQGVFVNEYDLRAIDPDTTEVSYTVTFPKMRGMAAVAAPIAFPLAGKPDIRKRLEMLKQKVEGSDAT
jgi:uncharacterized protein YndB with AHSA1/START domain